jgi:sulfite reductase (NADPH) hemoprotein beta-component
VDPRPYCELLRQWSTLHPEFAFLPRKFKIAVTGAREDRAATDWHDIGLTLHRNAAGEIGFRVAVGGGMGRTPLVAPEFRAFVPWQQILVYIEAVVRVYNLYGRRDNLYKARIKILVKAEGQRFVDAVNREFDALIADPATPLLPQAESSTALPPALPSRLHRWQQQMRARMTRCPHSTAGCSAMCTPQAARLPRGDAELKRAGLPPGDVTADQMEGAAELAERYSQANCASRTTRTCCCPGSAKAICAACGWRRAKVVSPRPTSGS